MSRRTETRLETRAAIHRLATAQLNQAGAGSISLNAIARELGMTGPALFRYVANRDEVLTELSRAAVTELADTLWSAVSGSAGLPVADRLRAHAWALYDWALAHQHRYLLLFGAPVPGFIPPADVLWPEMLRAIASVLAIAPDSLAATSDDYPAGPPALLAAELADWAAAAGLAVRSWVWLRQAMLTWSRLHGVLLLEQESRLGTGMPDVSVLFFAETEALVRLPSSP